MSAIRTSSHEVTRRPPAPGLRLPRPARKTVARAAIAAAAVAVISGTGLAKHAMLAASFALLGHVQWTWIAAAIVLESASFAALAAMQRRLLAAGGARLKVRSMLATTLAANALSVSVPLAGPEVGTAFSYRRFTRQGADAPLAGWSLLAGGVASAAAAAVIALSGGLASGKILAIAGAAATGLLAATAFAAVAVATRRPRLLGALERPAAWALRAWSRLLRRPPGDPRQTVRAWTSRLASLNLPATGWIAVTVLAVINWLADAAVLTVSIHAVGAAVPWHLLLLVYGSGVAAQGLNLTPGGLGVAEGTLGLALVAAGLPGSQALAAVLVYRLVSFWLAAGTGWLIFLRLRRHCWRRVTPPARPASRRRGGLPAVDGMPQLLGIGAAASGHNHRCHDHRCHGMSRIGRGRGHGAATGHGMNGGIHADDARAISGHGCPACRGGTDGHLRRILRGRFRRGTRRRGSVRFARADRGSPRAPSGGDFGPRSAGGAIADLLPRGRALR
jgi:putative heme transporter